MPDPNAVNSMFARIAHRYDVANRLLSGGMDVWWRRRLVSAVARCNPASVLDLATGSGDVAFSLARRIPAAVSITGMDFCQPMLDEAVLKQKHQKDSRTARITFSQGDGMALPLPDACVDAVTISFGLRNMADRVRSLSEIQRVLRPGGAVFILEFSQPYGWFRPLYLAYLRHVLPRIAGLVTGDRQAYVYLNESIEQFPDREALGREILSSGFQSYHASALSLGIVALHTGKKAPTSTSGYA